MNSYHNNNLQIGNKAISHWLQVCKVPICANEPIHCACATAPAATLPLCCLAGYQLHTLDVENGRKVWFLLVFPSQLLLIRNKASIPVRDATCKAVVCFIPKPAGKGQQRKNFFFFFWLLSNMCRMCACSDSAKKCVCWLKNSSLIINRVELHPRISSVNADIQHWSNREIVLSPRLCPSDSVIESKCTAQNFQTNKWAHHRPPMTPAACTRACT